jgi:hypothetical protein
MTRERPSYVPYADLQDDDLLRRQEGLSDRANLALAAACAEWLVHRYDGLSHDPTPHRFLQAMWAAVVDTRYVRPWEPEPEAWSGPVRGPLLVTMQYGQEAIREIAVQSGPDMAVLYLSGLAQIVLPNYASFLAWRNGTLTHLRALFPFDPNDAMGDVVPQKALDLRRPFSSQAIEPLVQSFLKNLDPSGNEFLHRPDEMERLLFNGTPYVFDCEQDRQTRNEW